MIVCVCKAVRSKELMDILNEQPNASLEQIQKRCGAGSDCGTCVGRLEKMITRLCESAAPDSSVSQPGQ